MDRDPFDLVGDVLDGQFRVDSFEGEGDLSVVYKGHHLGVDAPVAIKCLNLPATLDPALARPLVEGFKEASRLHYRLARGNLNIAQSIASGTTLAPRTGTVVPYLVREWFDGESLASDLESRRQQKRRGRSVDQARALLESAFDGLAFAHRENEVHLSVNPSNLFLARRADSVSLKVLDFGVARTMNDLVSGLPSNAGTAGLRLLFPAYAAPEQFDRTVGDLGPRTDVYSLALVAMEVLSDRVVMAEAETGALVARALDAHRRPTPEAHGLKLPRDLDRALARAVERSPDRRQRDAGELWDDLKNATRAETLRPTFSRTFSSPPSPAVAAAVAPAPASSGSLPAPSPSGSLPPAPPPSGPLPPPPQRPRARTLVGIGTAGRPMVAGAVAPPFAVMTHTARPPDVAPGPGMDAAAVPYVTTRPLSFEPMGASRAPALVPTPAPALVFTPAPAPAPVPALAPAPVPLAPDEEPVPGVSSAARRLARAALGAAQAWVPASRERPTLMLVAAAGALLWTLLLLAVGLPLLVALTRSHLDADKRGAAASVAVAPPPVTSPPAPAPEVPPESPPPAAPAGPFTIATARRALDATSHDVGRCRRGRVWGFAFATVTFSADGSVSHVDIGSPFTGTETASCIAEALGAARMDPFSDDSGRRPFIVYKFYVAPR